MVDHLAYHDMPCRSTCLKPKRHGTATLFAALEVFSGTVRTASYHRRRHRELLDFTNQVVAAYADRELHVIVDNLSSHKPKHDR